MDLDELLTSLRLAPAAMTALVELPAGWLHHEPGPEHWTAAQALAHMAALEESAWLPRVRHLLEHGDDVELPGVDPLSFRTRFPTIDPHEVVEVFASARTANLAALQELALDETALASRGRHPRLGEVRLDQLLATWAAHDHNHLVQAQEALASRMRDAVGPWRSFLPIVDRLAV